MVQEEQPSKGRLYLVELTWNDGVQTVFVILSPTHEIALSATETKALNMWPDGYIAATRVEVLVVPVVTNLPEHVYTDHSGYVVPS